MDKELQQILKDLAKQIAENSSEIKEVFKKLADSKAETDKQIKESNARTDNLIAKSRAETDKQIKESNARTDNLIAKSRAETDKQIKESNARTDKLLAEVGKYLKEVGEKVDELRKNYGGLGDNLGRETEQKIFAFLQKDKKIGNILFHYILMNLEITNGEIDAMLVNTEWVGILEVKRNLMVHDIKKYFTETLPKFDEHFADSDFVKKKKLYLFGCETIAPNAMEKLKEKGCFLIQPKYNSFTVTEIKKNTATASK